MNVDWMYPRTIQSTSRLALSSCVLVLLGLFGSAAHADIFNGVFVPGEVIAHKPASGGVYIGSPSIAVLPNGDYIASHDEFGPNSTEATSGTTRIFRSTDQGQTWTQSSMLTDQFWSNLFVHNNDLYIMGPRHGPTSGTNTDRDLLIRKSTNGGSTWTTPTNSTNGLLATQPLGSAGFHTAPVPIVEHHGRLWRALEVPRGTFRPIVVSAPADSDLLDASNWEMTNTLAYQESWLPNTGFNFWMEGNMVVGPDDQLVNVMRVSVNAGQPEKAAIVHVENTDHTPYLRFDPANDIVDMPGAAKKFTIRYDEQSNSYWSLTNVVNEDNYDPAATPGGIRNIVGLVKSNDLITWETRSIILQDLADVDKIGFQYLDWQFDGDDIVAVSRTSYNDGLGGAANFHDSNFLTFHRVENFRTIGALAASAIPEPAAGIAAILAALSLLSVRWRRTAMLCWIIVFSAASGTTNASLLVSEAFDYPAGNLHGRNGGTGWAAGWTFSDPDGTATVTASGLLFSDMAVSGRAARVQMGNTGIAFVDVVASRTLAMSVPTGTDLWMSFLYQQPSAPLPSIASRIAELRMASLKMRVRPKQSNLQGAAIGYDGSTFGDSDTRNLQDGQVYLMVARFGDVGQSTGEDATLWVLDAVGYDNAKFGGITINELDQNGLMILTDPHDNQSLAAGERLQMLVADSSNTNFGAVFDEIRYGTGLADVVPGLPAQLSGDFNDDGLVDAVDYTVWRNNLGDPTEDDINHNGDGLAGVDPGDYALWKQNYGESLANGSASGFSVPEASTVVYIATALAVLSNQHRRRKNSPRASDCLSRNRLCSLRSKPTI